MRMLLVDIRVGCGVPTHVGASDGWRVGIMALVIEESWF